ncbi:MAG: hypothetical protein ISF22_02760 [Methanomassiliicoccus sp.]|nr:hypothetical protein [Methanomassiliicoccus sp.]
MNEAHKKASILVIAGGAAFGAANFATSLTPLAAEYRAALSISYLPMIVESLLAGMIISCCLSYLLLRFFDKIPAKNPLLKSVILSIAALFIGLILVQVAASQTNDELNIFLIGAVINLPRFLALGIVVGYLYQRLYSRTSVQC